MKRKADGKKKLHTPPQEFAAAEEMHSPGGWWWDRQQEAIRKAEPERQSDYKQPRRPKKGPGLVR